VSFTLYFDGGSMDRSDYLKDRLRQIPIKDRLATCREMIGKMCKEKRPPRMTIPVQWNDEDFFISNTIADVLKEI
jgi:hypothetical protein